MTEKDATATRSRKYIYTLGHSRYSPERFLELLRQHGVAVLVDVRSRPYSRYVPHFNRPSLQSMVSQVGLVYIFMGDVLGGYPDSREFYDEKERVDYGRLAASSLFLAGVARLEKLAEEQCVCVMCSEEDPLRCHRYLLIGRVLAERGIVVRHIMGDGQVHSQNELAGEKSSQDAAGSGSGNSSQQHCQQQIFSDKEADTAV